MARKLIQDIVIKKSGSNFFKRNVYKKPEPEEVPQKLSIRRIDEHKSSKKQVGLYDDSISKNSTIFLWIICIVSVATLLFMLMSLFSSATVTVTPKKQSIVLSDSYSITSDKEVSGLHFQVINLKRNLSKSITSDIQENVERKATGKAMLYNNFSSANQRLINNTRLESLDGLIYRIRQSVDVPGIKTINGVKTPGSVEVDIIADMPGDKYNMKLSDFKGDFKIPGFKDSTKYTGFYARLSTDVTGGYIGKAVSVSDQAIRDTRQELKNNLSEGLIKDIYLQKPDQFLIFKDNYYIQFTNLPDVSGDKDYQIKEEATIYAIMFDKSELASHIAKNKLKDFDGLAVDVLWNDNIVATTTGSTLKPWNETTLKLKLVGDADIVWSYDKEAILSSVAGKNKSVLKEILDKNKKSIIDLSASISPSWKHTFPEKLKRIKILDSVRDKVAK